ncbi:MAG: phosphoglycerate mutase family protein [Ilumatobacteraceae bacterium]
MAPTHSAQHSRIYVVRHADAGVRGHGPDEHLRPLSPGGHARAEVLAELLELTSASRIVSSPYVRCVQTVEPLSARQRRSVELSDSLAEGASVEAMLHLLRRLPDGSVACTHGDMLGELARVVDSVDGLVGPISFDKGGVWVLARNGDALSLVEQMRVTSGYVGDRPVMMAR